MGDNRGFAMNRTLSLSLALAALVAGSTLLGTPVSFSESPQSLIGEAAQEFRKGDYGAAERRYRKALHLDPGNMQARMGICSVLNVQRRQAEAKGCLEALVGDHPAHQPAWFMLGTLYEAEGDTARAKAAYRKYVELGTDRIPPDPSVRIKLRQFGVL